MKISSVARLNFSIVALCMAALMTATIFGLVPDERKFVANNRAKLAESLATSVIYLVNHQDIRQVGRQFELFASRNDDVISAGLRHTRGHCVTEINSHENSWAEAAKRKSDGCYTVAINTVDGPWGQLELQFKPVYAGTSQLFSNTLLRLVGLVGLIVGVASYFHLRRMLKYLNPSENVPMRVRQTLDNFAEGVVILDTEDRMVLVNQKFASDVGRDRDTLLGTKIWDLPWQVNELDKAESDSAIGTFRGTRMHLADDHGQVKAIFSVNSSPVLDDAGKNKGVMMALTDITPMEMNRAALVNTLEDLSRTKQEISAQNERLSFLATRDPLTGCINRRTFFEHFEQHWDAAKNNDIPLGGMMVDIDFFKSINDDYGHSAGDEVLRQTGAVLLEVAGAESIVCRYGGEEFAVLIPGADLDQVADFGERIRIAISEMKFEHFAVTASVGVSGFSLGGDDPQAMLDQADKCLYVAKRNGRNKVVRFDTVPDDLIIDQAKVSRIKPGVDSNDNRPTIPYSAVSALVTALTYRDQQTGLHSQRVSGYAALLAQRLLSPSEAYVIEMAALLHDIGKIGIADSILLKPGPLTATEWEQMEKHDRIGIEILNKSFKHEGLTDIVRFHHYRYGGIRCDDQEIDGDDIPVGARILTIVDAYDAMVSDRPYRRGMPQQSAIDELKRHAGTQFDPELVEVFVSIIESGIHETNIRTTVDSANEKLLFIGEQIERLVEAADAGDGKSFLALAERLRGTAEQGNVAEVAEAAESAINAVSEDDALDKLVEQSFGLLAACRAMRSRANDENEIISNNNDVIQLKPKDSSTTSTSG